MLRIAVECELNAGKYFGKMTEFQPLDIPLHSSFRTGDRIGCLSRGQLLV